MREVGAINLLRPRGRVMSGRQKHQHQHQYQQTQQRRRRPRCTPPLSSRSRSGPRRPSQFRWRRRRPPPRPRMRPSRRHRRHESSCSIRGAASEPSPAPSGARVWSASHAAITACGSAGESRAVDVRPAAHGVVRAEGIVRLDRALCAGGTRSTLVCQIARTRRAAVTPSRRIA